MAAAFCQCCLCFAYFTPMLCLWFVFYRTFPSRGQAGALSPEAAIGDKEGCAAFLNEGTLMV
jgi:hypothetical protein